MITIKNCRFTNCGSAFGLGGNVNLHIDGLDVDNCGTAFDIDSQESNINAHTKNVNITNTGTYIKVGNNDNQSDPQPRPQTSTSTNRLPISSNTDDLSSIMRIATQYLNAHK